ncbi:MAG: hypothetical protein ACP5O6_08000, partial [Candidatus Baltobacteraceae bacterium]
LDLVRASGAQCIGVGAIVARSLPDFGVRFEALLEMPIESFAAEECPLCARGEPISTPGRAGREPIRGSRDRTVRGGNQHRRGAPPFRACANREARIE